jgi:hypothetical protein
MDWFYQTRVCVKWRAAVYTGSIKGEEFSGELNDCRLLKKYSAPYIAHSVRPIRFVRNICDVTNITWIYIENLVYIYFSICDPSNYFVLTCCTNCKDVSVQAGLNESFFFYNRQAVIQWPHSNMVL